MNFRVPVSMQGSNKMHCIFAPRHNEEFSVECESLNKMKQGLSEKADLRKWKLLKCEVCHFPDENLITNY